VTGSSSQELDQIIADWISPLGRERALAAMMVPANRALARDEIARLEAPGPRQLLEHDDISRRIHGALKALLAGYERAFPPPKTPLTASNPTE
jgi:hypothetical protein